MSQRQSPLRQQLPARWSTQPAQGMRTAQAAMGLGGTIDYFVDTVFDYPRLQRRSRSPL
jgi:hypothetical protein